MTYRTIIYSVLFAVAASSLTACSDWNEPEARVPDVNGAEQQDPAAYAAYTSALRQWKATVHPICVALLDNAPEKSTDERDFLRSLPDSLDIVVMRNPLSEFDRQDIAKVRADFATRILASLDCTVASAQQWQATADAIADGTFDGAVLSAITVPDPSALQNFTSALPSGKILIFSGSPTAVPAELRSAFSYFIIDATDAADNFDLEMTIRLAAINVDPSRLLLCVQPTGRLTDAGGVARNALAGAAVAARTFTPALGGIAIDNVGSDYYDPDIIYRRTRGAIQILNPAK